jgi:hypothetical protein
MEYYKGRIRKKSVYAYSKLRVLSPVTMHRFVMSPKHKTMQLKPKFIVIAEHFK